MATLEECGIRWLSASSVFAFSENPAYWVVRNMQGVKDPIGPSVVRSKAVKAGYSAWLSGKDESESENYALSLFELEHREIGSLWAPEKAASEYDAILPMLNGLFKLSLVRQRPIAVGIFGSVWLDGISAPFMTKPDFVFEDHILDVRTTHRIPSSARPRDVSDAALHYRHRTLPVKIAYISMKRGLVYQPTHTDMHIALLDLRAEAFAIEGLMRSVNSTEEALQRLPLNPKHYRWSRDALAFANRVRLSQVEKEDTDGVQPTGTDEFRETPGRGAFGDVLPGGGSWHPGGDD